MSIALTYPKSGAAIVAGGGGVVGRATVRKFAEAGVPVVFTYLGNEERAADVEREAASLGVPVVKRRLDLRDTAGIEVLLKDTARDFGRVHTVIYTAGPTLSFAPVRSLAPEQVEEFIIGDTMCCYRLFHKAIPVIAEGGGGSLVACATLANYRVIDADALSSMPKAAVEALVRQIAAEEAPNGIRANAIAIGWMGGWATTFDEALAMSAQMPNAAAVTGMIQQMIAMIRMKRPGKPEEAANLIAYLASDQASYVTGRTVAVDGGASL